MKKVMFLALISAAILVMASGASALTTNYDSLTQLGGVTIASGSATDWTHTAVSTGMQFTSALLTLSGSAVPSAIFPDVIIGIGASTGKGINSLYSGALTFTNGVAAIPLNVVNLNSYLRSNSGPIGITFVSALGTTTLNSARLTGTLAPEPISMALMGAGIVALPLARRFKKRLTTSC